MKFLDFTAGACRPRLRLNNSLSNQQPALACGLPLNKPVVAVNLARSNRLRNNRLGISLLEVVLALAILAVASAYLAQSMHIASQNASRSESQTQAEMVAESVMNQIVAGVLPSQSVSWTPYSNPNPFGSSAAFTTNSQWMYSISSLSTEIQGMIGVQVAVNEIIDGQTDDGKIEFYINRWMIDPSLGLDTPPTTDSTGATTSPGSTSTSSASSTGGVQ